MPDKQLTPIQQVMLRFNSMKKGNNSINDQNLDVVLEILTTFLPAEKQFAKDIWDASGAYGCYSDGLCSEYAPDFDELIKQYEP